MAKTFSKFDRNDKHIDPRSLTIPKYKKHRKKHSKEYCDQIPKDQ